MVPEDPIPPPEDHEILSFLTHHAASTSQQIQNSSSLPGLAHAMKHQERLVHMLLSSGVKIRYLGSLIQELDRKIFRQVASLLAPPEFFAHTCILVLGSEGRGEQILKTDQDNALLADETLSAEKRDTFAQAFSSALLQLGFPPCRGNVMMNHPPWNGSIASFVQRVRSWIDDPTPEHLLRLAVLYDARAIVGNVQLFQRGSQEFMNSLPNDPTFFSHFAMPALAFPTPLGLFKRFIVEKGSQQGRIDLKKGGIFPIIHGVRSLALEQRLKDPNTIRRIRALIRLGVLESSFGHDLIDAFEFMLGLRVRTAIEHAADHLQGGTDHPELGRLRRMEREHLRESLVQVERFKELIDHHFKLRILQ